MTKKARVFAALLAFSILLVFLSSLFFLVGNVNHDHVCSDCSICYQISLCEELIKTIGSAAVVAISAVIFCVFLQVLPISIKKSQSRRSLVTLKVKLLN